MREDLPAPEGPMMAVSSPERNLPEIHFRMVFISERSRKTMNIIVNS